MASFVAGPTEGSSQGEASLASAESAAMAAATAAFESPAPSAPPESALPAEPPPVPGQPAPPAAPVSAAPAPITIDPNTLDSEARAFFERKGGDVNRILADALRNDSRLAALARGEADPLGQVKLGAHPPQPTQPEPPAAPVAVDAQAFEQRVAQFYKSDPTCVQAIQTWKESAGRLAEIEKALETTNTEMQRARILATLDEIKGDPLRSQDVQLSLDKLEAQQLRLEQEKDLRISRRDRADETFQQAVAGYRTQEMGRYQQLLQEQQERETYEARVETVASELESAWEPALTKAMEDFKIPADERSDLNEIAMLAVYAELEKTGMSVRELPAFLAKHAQKYAERMDRNHRRQSAEYAKLAHERTALGGTQNGVVAAIKPTETEAPKDLQSLYRQTERDLFATFQGQRQ